MVADKHVQDTVTYRWSGSQVIFCATPSYVVRFAEMFDKANLLSIMMGSELRRVDDRTEANNKQSY